MSDPRPAGDFLRDIIQQAGTGKSRRDYLEAIEQILGATLAPHCQVVSCRAGRLVIEVDSAPLYAELSGFRREEIRLRVNSLLVTGSVKRIFFTEFVVQ